MSTIRKSEIKKIMNAYQDCAMKELISWLGEYLPKIHGDSWRAHMEKSMYRDDPFYCAKELDGLDLYYLLKTALSKSNFSGLCRYSNFSYKNWQIKNILEKMKDDFRGELAHSTSKPLNKASILLILGYVKKFFELFSDSEIVKNVEEFINNLKNSDIVDDTYDIIRGSGDKSLIQVPDDQQCIPQPNAEIENEIKECEDFYYYVENSSNYSIGLSKDRINGKYVVTGIGDCKDSIIVIPKTTKRGDNVYQIHGIAAKAFYRCTEIEGVVISEGIRFIGEEAFSKCTRLKYISIPHSLMSVGRDAFGDCDSLEGIYIDDIASWCAVEFESRLSNPLHLAKKMYLKGEEKNSLEIPEGVESICSLAFYECSFLENITFPSSLKTIGDSSFLCCESLKNVYLPNGINSIGEQAFACCLSFDEIIIPRSISRIDICAFYGCTGVRKIYYNAESLNDITENDEIFDDPYEYDESINDTIFANAGGVKATLNIVIGKNVKRIPEKLFKPLVPDVVYPESIPKCMNVFFENGSVCMSIDDEAFNCCKNLTSINLPDGLIYIGKYAFNGCVSLKEVAIPSSVENIGDYAFSHSGIIKATILDGVNSIGDGAFSDCIALKRINIPCSVIYLGAGAFSNDLALDNVVLSAQIPEIYPSMFLNCSAISKIVIPDSVEEICDEAFEGCIRLLNLSLSRNLKAIRKRAFYSCISLKIINIPEQVVYIDDEAFSLCEAVERIEFNSSNIISVSTDAFDSVGSQGKNVKIVIGRNVTKIPDHFFETVWDNYLNEVEFIKGGKCEYIGDCSFKGSSFRKINIPQSVTHIGKDAFYNTALTYVSIPKGITILQENVFGNCDLLEKINIPDSVRYICNGAFCGCSSLTDLTISEGVEYIGDNAFSGCESIKYLRIPSSVKHIGTMAFSGCVQLENIYFNAVNMEDLSSGDVFFDAGRDSENLTVTVGANVSQIPARLFCTYPTFVDVDIVPGCYIRSVIFEKESKCKKIGDAAFEDCLCLTDFFIPQSLKDMGENVFSECESLTDFYFIGDYEDFVKYCHNSSFRFEGNVKIYLYSECEPTEQGDGLYWYYDETGKPVHW